MNGLLSMVSRASEVGFIKGMTATAAVDFFNHLNMLYGTVTEFCTPEQVSFYVPLVLAPNDARHSVQLCPLVLGELPYFFGPLSRQLNTDKLDTNTSGKTVYATSVLQSFLLRSMLMPS